MLTIHSGEAITYNPGTGCFETIVEIKKDETVFRVASWIKADMMTDPKRIMKALHEIAFRRLRDGRALSMRTAVAPTSPNPGLAAAA